MSSRITNDGLPWTCPVKSKNLRADAVTKIDKMDGRMLRWFLGNTILGFQHVNSHQITSTGEERAEMWEIYKRLEPEMSERILRGVKNSTGQTLDN